jgi:hypothetical protein
LVINADNGPENNGCRTQWLKRLVEFSAANSVTVQLACYPPYHSKYNPVERVFGVLENYWNGDPLLTVDHALGMARNMTYKGVHPVSSLHAGGEKGVKLGKAQMKVIAQALERLEGVGKWFVKITPERACTALAKWKNMTS